MENPICGGAECGIQQTNETFRTFTGSSDRLEPLDQKSDYANDEKRLACIEEKVRKEMKREKFWADVVQKDALCFYKYTQDVESIPNLIEKVENLFSRFDMDRSRICGELQDILREMQETCKKSASDQVLYSSLSAILTLITLAPVASSVSAIAGGVGIVMSVNGLISKIKDNSNLKRQNKKTLACLKSCNNCIEDIKKAIDEVINLRNRFQNSSVFTSPICQKYQNEAKAVVEALDEIISHLKDNGSSEERINRRVIDTKQLFTFQIIARRRRGARRSELIDTIFANIMGNVSQQIYQRVDGLRVNFADIDQAAREFLHTLFEEKLCCPIASISIGLVTTAVDLFIPATCNVGLFNSAEYVMTETVSVEAIADSAATEKCGGKLAKYIAGNIKDKKEKSTDCEISDFLGQYVTFDKVVIVAKIFHLSLDVYNIFVNVNIMCRREGKSENVKKLEKIVKDLNLNISDLRKSIQWMQDFRIGFNHLLDGDVEEADKYVVIRRGHNLRD